MAAVQGGCRCGAVRYSVQADRLPPTYACHCLDCQTWSGSAFSQQAVVNDRSFTLSGVVSQFDLTSADGQRVSHQFACPRCFTRLFNTNTARSGKVVVRAGTFDASNQLSLVAHIWTKSKQPWLVLDPATPAWVEGAQAAEFQRLFGTP